MTYEDRQSAPATGVAGTVLGSIGTALGLGLFNGNGLFGNRNYSMPYDIGAVNCNNNAMILDIAQKDATIGQLRSEQSTDAKLVEVYKALAANDKAAGDKIAAISTSNAVMATKLRFVEGLLAQLVSPAIKNDKLWPGWGEVEVNPVTP